MFTRPSPRSENNLKFPFAAPVFKITETRYDYDRQKVDVRVRAYADSEAQKLADSTGSSNNGPMPGMNNGATIKDFNHTLDMAGLPTNPTATDIEAAVMALPEHKGAVAV